MPQLKHQSQKARVMVSTKKIIMLCSVFILGCLIGRVCIGNALWPFGPAYILAVFLNARQVNPYLAVAGVLTALASYINHMDYIAFNFALVGILASAMTLITYLKKRVGRGTAILTATGAYVACTLLFKLSLIYSVLTTAVELVICILMVMIMDNVIKLFFYARRRTVLTDQEIISLSFVVMIGVLGLGDINVLGVYLRNVAAIYLSMMAAYIGGATIGAGVGLAIGFAAVLGGSEPMLMANLGLAALAAGALKRLKKPGIVSAFILVNAIITFYINGSTLVIIPLVDTCTAALGFIFTPKKACEFLARYVDSSLKRNHEQKIHMQRFREVTVGRLKEMSHAFLNASQAFSTTTGHETPTISYMLADIPETACGGCIFYDTCWDKEFAKTYNVMQKLYMKYDNGVNITEHDLGQVFLKHCVRPQKVLNASKDIFYKHSTNNKWQNKVIESRVVVGDQLRGVSRVIESLSKEVDVDLKYRRDLEESIKDKLDAVGIRVYEVCVEAHEQSIRVTLNVKGCGAKGLCTGVIKKIVSAECGVPMSKAIDSDYCVGRKRCVLRYEQLRRFEVITGIAGACKHGNKVSGDAHSFEGLKDGRYMLLLCDGMGSGERAAKESGAAVSLMEDFYDAGFDDKTVLDAINKLLILSNSDETYSTMDLCMLDLISGTARFTKIGAPHSYVYNKGNIRKIDAGALPLGILDEFKPVIYDVELKSGDMIVMFTDGVSDLELSEEGVYGAIRDALRTQNAQEAADNILSAAIEYYGGQPKDDVTVMVSRIRQNKV